MSEEPIYNTYYFSMCPICRKTGLDLKTCSCCKSVSYCSKDHQSKDWPYHKTLCKVIKTTAPTISTNSPLTWEEWVRQRASIGFLWKTLLKRELTLYENQMWMFPKACSECYSRSCSITCESCLNAFYCSKEHQELQYKNHKAFCGALRACMEVDRDALINNIDKSVLKLSYNLKEQGCIEFPASIEELLNKIELEIYPEISDRLIRFIRITEMLTHAASLVYALKTINYVKSKKDEAESLIIHVVGAGKPELYIDWTFYFEFLFHWMPNLNKISIKLIGPELLDPYGFCNNQKSKGATSLEYHPEMYHNIEGLIKPDIIVAYNCGLHEFHGTDEDSWKDSLPLLVRGNTPLIITGYTSQEILRDLERLKPFTSPENIILKPRDNPFASCKPCRDWETRHQPIFYENGWICVLE